jgi:c-di-GMP-binding flagellar brake protein YcgR
VRIGQPVRVKLSQSANDYYVSRLVEQTPEAYFIDIPLHHTERHVPEIQPNSMVWVEYHGIDGALCRFASTYVESDRIPNLVWKIRRPNPKDVYREQRREYVRVPSDLPVRIEYTSEGQSRQEDVYSRDISGGGIALYLPRHVILRPGMLVDLKFTLPNSDFPVEVKSVVIRVSERNDRGFAIGSLQFVNIKESVRQRIIQYTFWRQRTML